MNNREQLIERNKQIALMLGLKPLARPYDGAFQLNGDDTFNVYFYHERMEGEDWYIYPQYNSDWEWLMQAVEFINKTHNQGNLRRDLVYTMQYLLCGGFWHDSSTRVESRLLHSKDNLFLAVFDYAKQYNEKAK
jgi:hypothetical protein